MWVKSLKLVNFRNYNQVEVNFSKGINIIQGENGSGKTSLVEAIGLLSMCKSIRSSDDIEMIKMDQERSIITACVENEIERDYKIVFSDNKKYIELDGNEIKKISLIVGITKVVSFLPKDVELFKDIPNKRRKFIDLNLSMLDKIYLKQLSEYNHYLSDLRNLLKEDDVDLVALDVIIDSLIKRGLVLSQKRKKFVDELNCHLQKIGKYFSKEETLFLLKYQPNVKISTLDNYLLFVKEKIHEQIKSCLKGRINIPGIHLDDISMDCGNLDLALFGSQGQNRLAVICLKLSLFSLIKEKFNEEPIVIFDDVLSELDEYHQNKLIELLKRVQQVFVTGTKFDLKQNATLFLVENNQVRRIN